MKAIIVLVLAALSVSSFAEGKPAYLDYTVDYLNQIYLFSGAVTLGDLFAPANSVQRSGDDGKLVVSHIDKVTVQAQKLSYVITTKRDGVVLLKSVLQFQLKDDEEAATFVSIRVQDLKSAKVSQAEFDGTMESLGRVLGIFQGVASFLVDIQKVNAAGALRRGETSGA